MESNSVKLLISDEAKKANDIQTMNSRIDIYTPKKGLEFKAIILNRGVLLGEDYDYFYFDSNFSVFIIFIDNDEYCTTFDLLNNTIVSVDVYKDVDDKYILYIDIKPLSETC